MLATKPRLGRLRGRSQASGSVGSPQPISKYGYFTASFGSMTSNATAAKMVSGNPIAEKLVVRIKREVGSKVVNLKDVIAGRAAAEGLQRTVVTKAISKEERKR